MMAVEKAKEETVRGMRHVPRRHTRGAVTRPTVESLTRTCTLAFICGRVEILIAFQFVTMHEQVGIQYAFMEMHQMPSIKFENPVTQWSFLCRVYQYKKKDCHFSSYVVKSAAKRSFYLSPFPYVPFRHVPASWLNLKPAHKII